MSKRAERKGAEAAPSQRQLRVAEEIRHALAAVLARGDVRDPELASARVTVTEVRASPDLKHMTVFVSRLGQTADKDLLDALRRSQPYLRTQVAKAVRLRAAPELHFQADTALDHAMRIDALMRRPEVARDLHRADEAEGEAGGKEEP
ncbi:30S ribosome-binding factor RbfA [Roseomonas gilardii]|uniref:30S ribosome-binding factor RbfA n=1 Tax=Roseomonas gilardii TaxID=257708 RepID=UPI0004802376|nr:30S ribosome-binding factor RbfA [Roseomonas gilardii]SUE42476.1 Ribosome-binding factor A [Roseomonas gilardii subsp. rosea]